jgi:hypothetical protein
MAVEHDTAGTAVRGLRTADVSAHDVIVLAVKNADKCIADREGVQYTVSLMDVH